MTALGRRGDTVMVSPGTSLHDENPGVREAILSGLVTGLAIAMPVGAVAALIVALTVRTSFRVGLGAAVGVATVDGAYAAAAVVGQVSETTLRVLIEMLGDPRMDELVSDLLRNNLEQIKSAVRERHNEDVPPHTPPDPSPMVGRPRPRG